MRPKARSVHDGRQLARRRHLSMVEVLARCEAHVKLWDEDYSRWFCGVTSDPEQAQCEMVGGAWLCYELESDLEARQLENSFRLEGCNFIPNAGGEDARYFYLYLSAPQRLQ